ncbi:MAG: hypothetical protein NTX86_04245 [Candidatus Dependentiae bacterium]|nr:hypothetical protein [Candidatus Dependentiae bacterium]
MKKLLLFMVLCTFSLAHADNLADAIREQDIKKIGIEMQQRNYLAALRPRYLEVAEENVRFRRDCLVSQRANPRMHDSYMPIVISAIFPTTFLAYSAVKEEASVVNQILFAASLTVLLGQMYLGHYKQTLQCELEYDSALRAKDLITHCMSFPCTPLPKG